MRDPDIPIYYPGCPVCGGKEFLLKNLEDDDMCWMCGAFESLIADGSIPLEEIPD